MSNISGENKGSVDPDSFSEEPGNSETLLVNINCVLNVPLMLVSIFGNALVILAITKTPSIRSSSSMIMVCSLALSDFLVGLVVQPLYIGQQLSRKSILLLLEASIGHSVCGASFLTITAISLDRFLALHYHLRYFTVVTKSRIICTAAIIWLFSFPSMGLYFWNKRLHRLFVGFIVVICFMVSTFSYVGIYRIVRKHQRQIHIQQNMVEGFRSGNNITRLKRSAVNTFLFYIALILCYFPFFVFITLTGVFKQKWKVQWSFSATVVFMNSSVNPFLYCCRIRELRTAVLNTLRKMLCKKSV